MLPSLYTGGSAMAAAARRVETASHNIANANTDGYTRQRVELRAASATPIAHGMIGTGVTVVSVARLRDALNGAAVRSESSVEGAASARATALTHLESALGTYGDSSPEAMASFMDAWDALSLTPGDPGARQAVLSAGDDLASSIRSAAGGLAEAGAQLRDLLGANVDDVNAALAELADIDKSVLDARTRGTEPNDLLDARDKALDKLAQLTGAKVTEASDGTLVVKLGTATLLQGTQAHTVTATAPPAAPAIQVDGATVSAGGTIGGIVGVLTGDLPALQTQLDAAANGLRDAVNTIHQASTAPDGSAGGPFYTGTGAADLQLSASLRTDTIAASRTGTPGDGSGALAMTALRTKAAVGTASVGEALTAVGVRAGNAASSAQRTANSAATSLNAALSARGSTDGVNADEEMIDLMSAQHAFEAAAKVVSVTDEIMQTIIGMVR